jgi:hypothetical protein
VQYFIVTEIDFELTHPFAIKGERYHLINFKNLYFDPHEKISYKDGKPLTFYDNGSAYVHAKDEDGRMKSIGLNSFLSSYEV